MYCYYRNFIEIEIVCLIVRDFCLSNYFCVLFVYFVCLFIYFVFGFWFFRAPLGGGFRGLTGLLFLGGRLCFGWRGSPVWDRRILFVVCSVVFAHKIG